MRGEATLQVLNLNHTLFPVMLANAGRLGSGWTCAISAPLLGRGTQMRPSWTLTTNQFKRDRGLYVANSVNLLAVRGRAGCNKGAAESLGHKPHAVRQGELDLAVVEHLGTSAAGLGGGDSVDL